MGKALYAVNYGVDSRHLTECEGVFSKHREAVDAYENLALKYPFKAKNLVRMVFEARFKPASDVTILKEIVV